MEPADVVLPGQQRQAGAGQHDARRYPRCRSGDVLHGPILLSSCPQRRAADAGREGTLLPGRHAQGPAGAYSASRRPKARLATADVPMTANSPSTTADGMLVTL